MKRVVIHERLFAELPEVILECDLTIEVEFNAVHVEVRSLWTPIVTVTDCLRTVARAPLPADMEAIAEWIEERSPVWLFELLDKHGHRAPRETPLVF